MKVSVIIPAYNVESFICDTLRSVLEQSHEVFEILVVDDGSKDCTATIAESVDKRVSVIRQTNAGASAARNKGLARARGDVIAFLDADDLWESSKIEQQLVYLEANPEVGSVASSFTVFGEGMKSNRVDMDDIRLLNYTPLDFLTSPRVHPSTLLCRSHIAQSVPFPYSVRDVEDVVYATLLRSKGRIGAVEQSLMLRRERPGQITKSFQHYKNGILARICWAEAHLELLGLSSPEEAANEILDAAADDVLANYWTRDLKRFNSMRLQLKEIWPKTKPWSKKLSIFHPPLLLLRMKDSIDEWCRVKKA